MVLIAVLPEMVTEVGAPLPVNVAVLSGTVGLELQLVPVVHSAPGPVHVPSTACADWGNSAANAPSQTPPSSAARAGSRQGGAAARMARPATEAAGADRRARAACCCERITPNPFTRGTAERGRAIRLAAPTDRRTFEVTDVARRDQFSRALPRPIGRRLWLYRHAARHDLGVGA